MRKKSRKSASTPQLKTRHGVFNSDEKRNQENLHQNPNSKPDMVCLTLMRKKLRKSASKPLLKTRHVCLTLMRKEIEKSASKPLLKTRHVCLTLMRKEIEKSASKPLLKTSHVCLTLMRKKLRKSASKTPTWNQMCLTIIARKAAVSLVFWGIWITCISARLATSTFASCQVHSKKYYVHSLPFFFFFFFFFIIIIIIQ